ncbi:MAG: LLM class flavin-dependent oxidoreductase [Alphaproteobacteria bacterium]
MKLSILDQSPIRSGATAAEALRETVALAEAADALGYHRYWVAEHHGSGGLAGSAPEILIGQIAARTRRLRVGSGGVMLNHYSALKVAETFRVLDAFHPGRIDLGLGRAPGSDRITALALAPTYTPVPIEHYPRQIRDLIDFLYATVPGDHPFARVDVVPDGETRTGRTVPEIWLLGSSDQSGILAGFLGQPFSFAHFITGEGGPAVMESYRRNFRPSPQLAEPKGSIGVHVVCANTAEEADLQAKPRDLWRVRADYGARGPVPTVEEALAHDYGFHEIERIALNRQRQVIGDPVRVKARLEELAGLYGVEEIVVLTITGNWQARLRSYELLAEAFGLGG